ncbi:MAG TPA: hypothetical protein VFV70_06590 [Hyphomonadaceae bacterium]|nr:hypothetical protein [Hyphomonadaceae bacterium]
MRLKVFKAFAATWAVLFRNGLDVLRIVWLPVALQLAAYYALMPGFLTEYILLGANPPADFGETWTRMAPRILPFLGFLLVACVTTIIIYAGLTRLIVRGEKPKLPFLLSWGSDEWRLLAGWGIILAFAVGVAIAFWLVGQIVGALGLLGRGPITIILGFGGALVVLCAGAWAGVRLSLFAPATIAERKIGIQTSWEKTEDDFWNLLGFWVLWFVVVIIVQIATFNLITPPEYFEVMRGGFSSPEEMRETMREANEALARGYDLSVPGNALRMLWAFLINFVFGVFATAAGAVAWRMMTDASVDARPSQAEPAKA